MVDVEHARERLREWAAYFKDRHRQGSAGSAERRWRSPQIWYPPEPRPAHDFRRAVRTHELLRDHVPKMNFRAVTWKYCFGSAPVHIALRSLSRHANYRVTLAVYQDLTYFAECRLAVLIETGPHPTASLRPGAAARVAAVAPARARTSDAASLGVEN
jgi:hypothetical protein